jgi:biotin carboxyl carrier protein
VSDKVITIRDATIELALERDGAQLRAEGHVVEIISMRPNEAELRVDGRSFFVPYAIDGTTVDGPRVSFAYDGEIYTADVAEKGARTRVRQRDQSMAAPMPGIVLKVLVKVGDAVTKGMPLLILEAMKMEHPIVAPRDGVVDAINCAEGELVQPGVELVTLRAA